MSHLKKRALLAVSLLLLTLIGLAGCSRDRRDDSYRHTGRYSERYERYDDDRDDERYESDRRETRRRSYGRHGRVEW